MMLPGKVTCPGVTGQSRAGLSEPGPSHIFPTLLGSSHSEGRLQDQSLTTRFWLRRLLREAFGTLPRSSSARPSGS